MVIQLFQAQAWADRFSAFECECGGSQPQPDRLDRLEIAEQAKDDARGQGVARAALLSCLRGGWKNLVDLNLRPVPSDDPFAVKPWIPPGDMVIIVAFGGADGKAQMAIVYPYLTLEPLMGVLG